MVKSSIRPTAKRSPRAAPQFSTLTQKYAATILAPLRRGEAAAARKLALAAVVRDKTIRAERTRIYEPTLRIEKAKRRGGPPARIVWVRIRDRDRGLVHEISVATGEVIEHIVNEHANPPFSDEEREDARRAISCPPFRSSRARRPSASSAAPLMADTSRATGRPRSVMTTMSPCRTRSIKALSWFLASVIVAFFTWLE